MFDPSVTVPAVALISKSVLLSEEELPSNRLRSNAATPELMIRMAV